MAQVIPFQAELPDNPLNSVQPLKPVLDGAGQIAVFPAGHTALDHELQNFYRWAEKKCHTPVAAYLLGQGLSPVSHPAPQRAAENAQTLTLYKSLFDSFLWTGIECSNPHSPQGERWDQLALSGMYQATHRRRQIALLKELGIENVRLGLPTHRIAQQKSWRPVDRMLNDFSKANLKISLDLQHFGLPDSLLDNHSPAESLYLNPKWPAYFERFARQAVTRYADQIQAVTLINEPLITNRFSGCFWNEAMPGSLSDERYYHFFIRRALLIAQAAVAARHQIELFLQRSGQRLLFIHNESCEHHADHPEFNRYARFLASDLILGHSWFLEEDIAQTEFFAWMSRHVDDPRWLLGELTALREKHRAFEQAFGKTMQADTVFGVDYYAACETVQLTCGFPQPTCVETYTEQINAGHRLGLAGLCVQYWDRYHLPILHTETNFPDTDEWGLSDHWGVKQLAELAQLPKLGIPVLGFTWYSLMDQFNWHNALQGSPQAIQTYPVGLYSWPDYHPRAFTRNVLPGLQQSLQQPSLADCRLSHESALG